MRWWPLVLLVAGCEPPKNLRVERNQDGLAVIAWETAAMGLYVTDPGAVIPGAPRDTVKDGRSFWVIEATTFPTGFNGPVVYGELPGGAKEATEKHGGVAGGEKLIAGSRYKFSVVSLGGQLAVEQDW